MSMIESFTMRAVARQPLFLTADAEAGNHRSTAQSVSASTLRGAVAALWLREHTGPDAVFDELFDGAMRWPSLHPQNHVLVPLSVRRCKYRPKPECESFALDTFPPAPSEDPAESERRCEHCEGLLELAKGELVPLRGAGRAQRMTRTSAALTADETASEGQLFSRDAVAPGSGFSGTVEIAAGISGAARDWLTSLTGRRIRVGGRRSVAGALQIEFAGFEEIAGPAALQHDAVAAIRLQSPMVLIDRFGAPTTEVGGLFVGTGLEHAVEVLDRLSYVRPVSAGGWNALAGMPRPAETALAAGSTVVVRVVAPDGIAADDLCDVVSGGLGVRRNEGFGSVTVATRAWQFPEETIDDRVPEVPAGGAVSHPLFDLVGQIEDLEPRRDVAAWMAGRLRTFAQRIRQSPDRRAGLVEDARGERSLRGFDRPVVEAYLALLADESMGPGEIQAVAEAMVLHELAESMRPQS